VAFDFPPESRQHFRRELDNLTESESRKV
jgi:hypothetical protein